MPGERPALVRKLAEMAEKAHLDQQSPLKEQLEISRRQYLASAQAGAARPPSPPKPASPAPRAERPPTSVLPPRRDAPPSVRRIGGTAEANRALNPTAVEPPRPAKRNPVYIALAEKYGYPLITADARQETAARTVGITIKPIMDF